jgi:amino acid transporter
MWATRHFESIICFLMAAFGTFFGVTSGEFRPGALGRNSTGKPLPIWFGRMWFLGFAAIMLYLGIRGLR